MHFGPILTDLELFMGRVPAKICPYKFQYFSDSPYYITFFTYFYRSRLVASKKVAFVHFKVAFSKKN